MRAERAGHERVIVASKDSLRARLASHAGADYRTIVTDETHHSSAASYRRIYDAFPAATRIGLTATPYRHDKKTLWMYDAATTPFGVTRAISEAWLVPVRARRIVNRGIDISDVRVTAGDLNQGDLAAVMRAEAAVAVVVDGLLAAYSGRPTILYAVDVATAEMYTRGLCAALGAGAARLVTGETDSDERRVAIRDLGVSHQVLVNVGVATEGTDVPAAACIVIARPTRSESLFRQMLGRGLRPARGLVGDSVAERARWIANSGKPHCLVVDIGAKLGRHRLASAAAVYGGDRPEAAAAVEAALDAGQEVTADAAAEAIERAAAAAEADRRTELERARARITGRVRADVVSVAMEFAGAEPAGSGLGRGPTPSQVAAALEYGLTLATGETASALAQRLATVRRLRNMASPKQVAFIARHYPGTRAVEVTAADARRMIARKITDWQRSRG
jgi:superfamily II DNA or RNA helicase